MNTNPLLFAAGLSLALLSPDVSAQLICVADFALMGQGQVRVEIKTRPDGLFDAAINGATTRTAASATEEQVRPNLNLDADPYGKEFASFNAAEKSLVQMHLLLGSPDTRHVVKIPFDPKDVNKVRTYDLIGKSDKFGGTVLLEAFTEAGAPLGRVLRRVLAAECR